MRRSRFLAMVMVGALALGATACGGDDDDDDASSSESESSDDSGDDDSGDDDSGDDDSAVDDDSGDDDDAVSEEDLDDLEDGANLFTSEACAEAFSAYLAAFGGLGTVLGGEESDDSGLDSLEEYVDNAPDEIADDIRTVFEGMREYYEAIADSGLTEGEAPDADMIEELTEMGEELNTEEFQTAADNVNEWFTTECAQG